MVPVRFVLLLTQGSLAGTLTRPRPASVMPNMGTDPLNVLQGSPTYKQRRRRTSISQQLGMVGSHVTQYGHRPRAASVADGSLRNSLLNQGFQRHTTPLRDIPYSRTTTPAPSHLSQPIFQANDELARLHMDHHEDRYGSASPMPMDTRSSVTPGPGGDSPAKTFTCPVPSCGRLFKRLEHLKRHVRTHTQERPYVCGICAKKFSRSDNLAQYVFCKVETNYRHRKTHERNGASNSARNTPCDSSRNTPVSGDEEVEQHKEEAQDDQLFANAAGYTHGQSLHTHFRSFSHDGHLNHYNLAPTSHGLGSLGGLNGASPPAEVEEAAHVADDRSPADTDGSHSYHDEVPPSYAHQPSYQEVPNPLSDELLTAPKNPMVGIQNDTLRKDYMTHSQMMDPSMMNSSWGFR